MKSIEGNLATTVILKKDRARKEIHFVTDFSMDPDGWFISVKSIQSGKVTSESCIIKKDLEQWIDSYRREGWFPF